ncbi:MAG: hypothetical protein IVW57_02905 [Ktedonobacterales bacterium]|nr:hypothetical protein [Ktedonobacterales bacterium]
MARAVENSRSQRDTRTNADTDVSATETGALTATPPMDREKVLPLPSWLVKIYFIFPIILYIPDAIFNYYVYSDGAKVTNANAVLQGGQVALWGFLSVGVVGMAYLLSVLAPWHWGQGHKMQAFFCGLGVLIATGITTWNSLSFRSANFNEFKTDQWAYQIFPGLQASHISLTMVLVAIAPPFWGLFWALVQPTQSGRSLAQLQESHAERLMRMQQDAELKRLRAETNAKIREAQVRGMAQTATAVRAQFGQARKGQTASAQAASTRTPSAQQGEEAQDATTLPSTSDASQAENEASAGILRLPPVNPARGRDLASSRGASFMNNVAPATSSAYAAPANGAHSPAAQPMLLSDADVHDAAGMPASDTTTWGPRRPATIGGVFAHETSDAEAMTGTSGPHHTLRRPTEVSSLMRGLGELRPAYAQAVREAMQELNPTGKRRIAAPDLVARVAEKLNVDETMARQIISRYREQQRSAQRP